MIVVDAAHSARVEIGDGNENGIGVAVAKGMIDNRDIARGVGSSCAMNENGSRTAEACAGDFQRPGAYFEGNICRIEGVSAIGADRNLVWARRGVIDFGRVSPDEGAGVQGFGAMTCRKA